MKSKDDGIGSLGWRWTIVMNFVNEWSGYTLHEWSYGKHGDDLERAFAVVIVCVASSFPQETMLIRKFYECYAAMTVVTFLVVLLHIAGDACSSEGNMGRDPGACVCNRHWVCTFLIWKFGDTSLVSLGTQFHGLLSLYLTLKLNPSRPTPTTSQCRTTNDRATASVNETAVASHEKNATASKEAHLANAATDRAAHGESAAAGAAANATDHDRLLARMVVRGMAHVSHEDKVEAIVTATKTVSDATHHEAHAVVPQLPVASANLTSHRAEVPSSLPLCPATP
jgi:hypothetical protein